MKIDPDGGRERFAQYQHEAPASAFFRGEPEPNNNSHYQYKPEAPASVFFRASRSPTIITIIHTRVYVWEKKP